MFPSTNSGNISEIVKGKLYLSCRLILIHYFRKVAESSPGWTPSPPDSPMFVRGSVHSAGTSAASPMSPVAPPYSPITPDKKSSVRCINIRIDVP